ncbi:MAG TPA: hypothetical protein VH880_10495 [Anaeromyxobacteraceae bacterium]|jgi:hypothetical protein
MQRTSALVAISLAAGLAPRAAAPAEPAIPVRVRVIKGSRQGPPAIDPRLEYLRGHLGKLAWQRWEQVSEEGREMRFRRPERFALPAGESLELTLEDARRDTVTFRVRLPARQAQSRLTISKDQRIVHQITDEKGGEALFATVRPWP